MNYSGELQVTIHSTFKLIFLIFLMIAVAGCGSKRVGEASWYGAKFHGRLTASGEVYNRNALTAAHATLPFGTRVRVTEIESGRNVVVTINDRFPGTKGRIIDLSEAAFAQLAPTGRGVIQVRLEVLD